MVKCSTLELLTVYLLLIHFLNFLRGLILLVLSSNLFHNRLTLAVDLHLNTEQKRRHQHGIYLLH